MILARTIKGKGVSFVEGKEGWHGRAFKKGEELDNALDELESQFVPAPAGVNLSAQIPKPASRRAPVDAAAAVAPPAYKLGEEVATREAYGVALAKLGDADRAWWRSTPTSRTRRSATSSRKSFPDRFYQNFIAEQVMIGAAMGLAARGAIPFPSTFACFLTRAADFIRMAAISNVEHQAGRVACRRVDRRRRAVADGARGSRDVPGGAELHRAVSVRRRQHGAPRGAGGVPPGPRVHPHPPAEDAGHLRRRRDVRRRRIEGPPAERRRRRTVVGAGVTVFEALKAHDELKAAGHRIRVIDLYSLQPIDATTLIAAGTRHRRPLITVEDHYAAGGIGDAVAEAWRRGSRSRAWRSAKYLAAESPTSCSIATASPPGTSSTRCENWRSAGLQACAHGGPEGPHYGCRRYVIASAAGESGHTGCAAAT